ncbi:MAG: hypothetical protein AB1742_03605 [bacterium]
MSAAAEAEKKAKTRRAARRVCAALVLAGAIFAAGAPVRAHKVNIFAWVEGDVVRTESYFSGGAKCRNSKVSVLDPAGTVLAAGTTDDEGGFSFKPTVKTDLRIVLDAGMGHRGEFLLPAGELPDVPAEGQGAPGGGATPVSEKTAAAVSTGKPRAAPGGAPPEGARPEGARPAPPSAARHAQPRRPEECPPFIGEERLRAIIEAEVEKKVAPLRKMMLDERRRDDPIAEIIVGIGLIAGVMALLMFLKRRPRGGTGGDAGGR